MCFSAIHWARISRIVYGADISDAHMAGFNELKISNRDLKRLGRSKVKIKSGVLRDECVRLFHAWKNCPDRKTY
jgi:tRNA(Arg) A34 adenosine deaminase TadA